MSAGWKTLDTQNSSLTIDLSEDEGLTIKTLHKRNNEVETSHILAKFRDQKKKVKRPVGEEEQIRCLNV
jgi:hypothetical protein